MMPASTKRHGKLLLLLFLIMMHTRALFGFEYAKLRWRAFNCNYYTYSRFSTLWATGGMERLRTDRNAATALKSTVHMAYSLCNWRDTIAPQQLHSSLQSVRRLLRQSNAQARPLRAFCENHSMCMNINLHLNLAWKYFNETSKSGIGGGGDDDDDDVHPMC